MRVILVMALGLLLGACATASGQAGQGGLIVKASPYGVSETMGRLQAAVTARGARVFARIDHAAGAHKAGLSLAPEQVLIFGNPKLGTPLMRQNPRFGLDLPLKILVWQEDGTTRLAYTDPAALGARYGVDPDDPVLVKMGKVLEAITSEALRPSP